MLEYSFEQLVDLNRVRSLLQAHYKITGVCSAILDLEQNTLVAEGWEDICTRFHRVHSVTCARCLESNEQITHRLHEVEGDFREIKCKNGLWDIAMPIVIDGRMLATFFIGQFFYDDEEVDEAFFRAQAAEFGFVEEPYIAALRKVPVFSRKQVRNILDFYRGLIQILAESGLKKLRLLQEVEDRKKAEKALAAREREFRSLAENLPDSVARWDTNGRYLYINPTFERALGVSASDCIGKQSPERHAEVREAIARVAATGWAEHSIRQELMAGDGCVLHNISFVPEFDEDRRIVSVLGIGRDMTKFYRMQETIAAREQEYRTLAESSPDFIVRYDRNGRMLYLNTALQRSLNLNAVEEVIGKRANEAWPDGRFASIEQAADCAINTGTVQTVEVRVPLGEGDMRSDHILIVPERDVAGQIIGAIAFGRDITESKRLETALKESETRLQTVMRTMPDMVWLKNSEGVYLFCNHAFERLTGKSEADIVNGTDYDIFDADLADFFRQKDKAAIEAGRICINKEWVTYADNEQRALLETRKVPVLGSQGQVVGVLGVARDITERNKTEEQLALLSFALNHVHEAAFLIDEEARFHYVNHEACRALGYSRDELIDLTVADVDPDVSLAQWPAHWSSLKANDSLTFEGRHLKMNGHTFPVEINANYFEYDGQGYNLALVRDITERKQIETELQNKNRELESFTYTVSHDLKSPLITIRGFAGAIISDLAAGRNDRVDKDLQRISSAADTMMTLLDDLLQLSRIGRVINPPEPVDMTGLASEVVANLSSILLENGAQVSVQSAMPTVSCDRQRISEVLQNLIENGVKYRGEQSELQIQIGLREEGQRQVFFVQDNGAGIPPKYHQHIFGLFNRLDTKVPGNGIGLSLVKRIIEEHGGSVWVESDGKGAGSTFCFSLNCPAFKEGEWLQ